MIRANIQTEVSPIVGSEKQSEELVNYLLSGFENDPTSIWSSNIFGKNLNELVNEGSGGLICIISHLGPGLKLKPGPKFTIENSYQM